MSEGAPSATCVLFDVVGMQTFNDKNGWNAGDNLLAEIMSALSACFSPACEVTRLSGDEFLVVASNGDIELAAKRARYTSEEIQNRFGVTIVFGVGSGVSIADATQSATLALWKTPRR